MNRIKAFARRNRHVFLSARALKHRIHGLPEPELALLQWIVDGSRTALDIGAHSGLYSAALKRLVPKVIAVEAIPELAENLARLFPDMEVINAAASDHTGRITLSMPDNRPGLSSVAHLHFEPGLAVKQIDVACITIDELVAQRGEDIGFIKIDVEGHELEVLAGARHTIASHRPALLIEAEERHRPGTVAALFEFFDGLNYGGFFLDGRLRSLRSFDPATHQSLVNVDIAALDRGDYAGKYINNFIFLS